MSGNRLRTVFDFVLGRHKLQSPKPGTAEARGKRWADTGLPCRAGRRREGGRGGQAGTSASPRTTGRRAANRRGHPAAMRWKHGRRATMSRGWDAPVKRSSSKMGRSKRSEKFQLPLRPRNGFDLLRLRLRDLGGCLTNTAASRHGSRILSSSLYNLGTASAFLDFDEPPPSQSSRRMPNNVASQIGSGSLLLRSRHQNPQFYPRNRC